MHPTPQHRLESIARALLGGLRRSAQALDRLAEFTGRSVAWLTLALMAITCLVVLLRYGFGIGSIALQESITYLHATVFLMGAAFTLKRDGHVRVDIFYRHFTPYQQAWVNSLGSIVLLLPLCIFLGGISWHFVESAWRIKEVSADPGGLPAVFLLKSLLPLAAGSLALQGLAEILRNMAYLIRPSQDPDLACDAK